VLHWVTRAQPATIVTVAGGLDAQALEDQRVAGAIRTDFILSAEIMAIALANITAPDLLTKALVLAAVALLVTVAVYGAVALIVKADDLGVALARRGGAISGPVGRALVYSMPPFLQVLSVVGTLAMLWVGGGILVHGLQEYGIHAPEDWVHALSDAVRGAIPVATEVFAWIAGAFGAAAVGLIAGAATALLVKVVSAPFAKATAP
jgi:predicted DNA repair protein MutK